LNRQVDALRQHGFDADSLLHSKVILVESDLTLPTLGITPALFEEVTLALLSDLQYFHICLLIDSKLCYPHCAQRYDFERSTILGLTFHQTFSLAC
jgi:hypothetical protein